MNATILRSNVFSALTLFVMLFLQPILGSHTVLSSPLTIPRGWPLNTGSTVNVNPAVVSWGKKEFPHQYLNPWPSDYCIWKLSTPPIFNWWFYSWRTLSTKCLPKIWTDLSHLVAIVVKFMLSCNIQTPQTPTDHPCHMSYINSTSDSILLEFPWNIIYTFLHKLSYQAKPYSFISINFLTVYVILTLS